MAVNVGLDIGTSAVRAAVVQTTKEGSVLRRYGEVALPEGAVVAGEIVDEQVVGAAVNQLFKSAKLPRKRVVVGIANQRVIVRRVDLPAMSEDELSESLAFQAQDYIPIPIDEAVLDFVPLEEFSTPDGDAMQSVLVIAAQQDMARDVLRVMSEGAGLKVMAIDLQAFALVRAVFGADLSLEAGAQAIVNIGAGLTQVILVRGGNVRFLRIVPMGGEEFTRAIQDRLDLSHEDAEVMKKRVGVAIEGEPEGGDDEDVARATLTRQADQLIEEIRSSLEFYLSQSEDDRVDQLLIAGNSARLPHLANRISRLLGVGIAPVRVLGTGAIEVGKVGLSETELSQAQPVLPIAVGLALWGET